MTYAWLSLIFVAVAAAALVAALLARGASRRSLLVRWGLPVLASGAVVMILTAIFDNVMIRSGLMAYSAEITSGLLIGVAPVEDFAYPLAGLILLPALWLLFGGRKAHDR